MRIQTIPESDSEALLARVFIDHMWSLFKYLILGLFYLTLILGTKVLIYIGTQFLQIKKKRDEGLE